MSKSAIYTVNGSSQNVAVNGIIDLGSIIRRFGPNLNLAGNAIQVCGSGYYDLNASITLAPTAIGNVTVSVFKDNAPIPGATATESVETANNPVNISINALIREMCPCCDALSNLTFVLTGTAASVTNIAVKVDKI